MAWNSTLNRKKPLKAKFGFKPVRGLKSKLVEKPYDKGEKPSRVTGTVRRVKKPSKSGLMLRLDMVFSLYIRLRDAMEGGRTVCISCGRTFPFEQMQCGHYHSRRNLSTRWDEDNCNSECAFDNCFNPSHLKGYTANLLAKIGQERFNALSEKANEARRWCESELRDAIERYTAECRRLSKEKGISIRL